jgi:hypothetical protein
LGLMATRSGHVHPAFSLAALKSASRPAAFPR